MCLFLFLRNQLPPFCILHTLPVSTSQFLFLFILPSILSLHTSENLQHFSKMIDCHILQHSNRDSKVMMKNINNWKWEQSLHLLMQKSTFFLETGTLFIKLHMWTLAHLRKCLLVSIVIVYRPAKMCFHTPLLLVLLILLCTLSSSILNLLILLQVQDSSLQNRDETNVIHFWLTFFLF